MIASEKPCLVKCEQCGLVSDLNDSKTPFVLMPDGDDYEKVPRCPNCQALLC